MYIYVCSPDMCLTALVASVCSRQKRKILLGTTPHIIRSRTDTSRKLWRHKDMTWLKTEEGKRLVNGSNKKKKTWNTRVGTKMAQATMILQRTNASAIVAAITTVCNNCNRWSLSANSISLHYKSTRLSFILCF